MSGVEASVVSELVSLGHGKARDEVGRGKETGCDKLCLSQFFLAKLRSLTLI